MDWKILAAIIIAVAIVVSGVLSANTNVIENVKKILGEKFGGIFSQETVNATILFDATLSLDNIKFETPVKKIELNLMSSSSMKIGGEKFNFPSNSVVTLTNFNGLIKVNIKNKTIFINGDVGSALINDISIFPHEKERISVNGEGINFETIKLFNVSINEFSYNSSGNINMEDKVSIVLDNEFLEIDNYNGDIEISDSVKMKGFVNKVFVNGELKSTIE